ncbi:MAG: hypothetical protein GVY06_09055 [Alphaproteobacteria bacterium]|jgi:hypothetical protein|nr:hypothetical protein [Alphaproteobacteria bacterium]
MQCPERFRGQSGKVYGFRKADGGPGWRRQPGLALLAAVDGYGWRIIRIVEIPGIADDVGPIRARREAARYGAETLLVLDEPDASRRRAIRADLEAGLSPLWRDDSLSLAA